jgi:hypothetical protein
MSSRALPRRAEYTQLLAERHNRFRVARSYFRRSRRRDVAVQFK